MITKKIKDPIHSFIEFEGSFELELKNILSDASFQRLRRVKQLGFSDYVFPSATHSRFAHSLGVYSVAKRMLSIIEPNAKKGDWSLNGQACLAAALLHDVGHGMFSHAFEKAMDFYLERNPNQGPDYSELKDATDHEKTSQKIITQSSITKTLSRVNGERFPKLVADMINKSNPNCIYTSIVSGQLDADRLDYVKRDPYFAGVSSGSIDLDWLIRNLRVGENGQSKFLYVDNKAYISLEQFTVTLFQLYPTIYLHKQTRSLEYMFAILMSRIFELIADKKELDAGLSPNHPFVSFFRDPKNLENSLSLDDTLFWGSLHLLTQAKDSLVKTIAKRISERKIYPMLDIWKIVDEKFSFNTKIQKLTATERVEKINSTCKEIAKEISSDKKIWTSDCYYDTYDRPIYRAKNIIDGHPQQINIQVGGRIMDIASISPIVASAASFNIHRIYYDDANFGRKESLEAAISAIAGRLMP